MKSTLIAQTALAFLTLVTTHAVAETTYEPYLFTTLAGNAPGSFDGTGAAARFNLPTAVAVVSSGDAYVADQHNHTIRKITPDGVVSTFAGVANTPGSSDGTGSEARFRFPTGIAADSQGNLYVTDSGNHTIRKVAPDGVVTTLAGSAGSSGSANGSGNAARFNDPEGVAVDVGGNLVVADRNNDTIRRISPGGLVTTLAGLPGVSGSNDGVGSAARFNFPGGVAVAADGTVYVADTYNHTIRTINLDSAVTTLAGVAGMTGSTDGSGVTARFLGPIGIAVTADGYVYVVDAGNSTIRGITRTAEVSTLAGLAPQSGSNDGTGGAARFNSPWGVAIDVSGNLVIADTNNHTLRLVTRAGVVTTVAGSPSVGSADGLGNAARFASPFGLSFDQVGNLYVADNGNYTIRKVTVSGEVSTLAGSPGSPGVANGMGSAARFNDPVKTAVDSGGNVYVADSSSHTIRKITPQGLVTTLAGLAGQSGSADGIGSAARFSFPSGVATDSGGNVYVGDTGNSTIRKFTSAGVVTTFAGSAGQIGNANGMGAAARFQSPEGLAVDSANNVYVADYLNNRIRKITPNGLVTTVAGSNQGSADGTGSAAAFNNPRGLTVDDDGYVYVADSNNHTVRKITPNGVVTTLAGLARIIGSADGAGPNARFFSPMDVAADHGGKIFVADQQNNTIRSGELLLQLGSVVSRETHGAAGDFDIDLPLLGARGVECRNSGGNHSVVFTFNKNIASGQASVTSGTGNVVGTPLFTGRTITVNLTGVSDSQAIVVTLTGVTDETSQMLPETSVGMNVLIGDTSGNKTVNATDVGQAKGQSGAAVTNANFRADVNLSGAVNASDIAAIKANAGHSLP